MFQLSNEDMTLALLIASVRLCKLWIPRQTHRLDENSRRKNSKKLSDSIFSAFTGFQLW